MTAAFRKIAWCLLSLLVGYHGYATAAVTCHNLKVEIQLVNADSQAEKDDCPDMRADMRSDMAEGTEGSCCKSKSLCCSSFVVPYAPVPSFLPLSAPSTSPERSHSLQADFSSFIPPVLDPPPRA
ncbi:MAG: hypothetical protein ACRYF7_10150 [Janthinobacterium lividum]